MLLAIETSCDETAVAITDPSASDPSQALLLDLVASQTKLHDAYGGVVPELAAREHIANLPVMTQALLSRLSLSPRDLSAVAVTRGPGLKGCLLVGLCYAKSLALALEIPLLALHHIEGHILAGWLMPSAEQPELPLLALVVSGGHTMLVAVDGFRSYTIIAGTRDDAAGEAFDKSATLLNLPYPGGPALSRRAAQGRIDAFPFPIGVRKDDTSFSFSGLKTAVQRTVLSLAEDIEKSEVVDDLAASVQHAICRALVEKSVAACKRLSPRSFLLTGGVAANEYLRGMLALELGKLGIKFCVPERRFCTDNAAMMGALAQQILANDPDKYKDWKRSGDKREYLGPGVPRDIGAKPKWPLNELFGV